jgi:hypothetical protein
MNNFEKYIRDLNHRCYNCRVFLRGVHNTSHEQEHFDHFVGRASKSIVGKSNNQEKSPTTIVISTREVIWIQSKGLDHTIIYSKF